jgi:hypothetical protein
LRLIGRGLSDTFEHLLGYVLASLAWWVAVLTVVAAPAATVALFAFTDPRRAIDRPEWRDVLVDARRGFARGWAVTLIVGGLLLVLVLNLYTYGGTGSELAWLAPLWVLLLLIGTAIGLATMAAVALIDAGLRGAFKWGAYVVASAPFRSLFMVLMFVVYVSVGGLLVIPLIMLVPALIAATVNRLVLGQLQIPVVDPLAPTEERVHEEQRKRASKIAGG